MIKLNEIQCGYNTVSVLSELSLSLAQVDFTVIMGPNGAGKSTLLYAIMGFIGLRKGKIEIRGRDLASYKRSELARIISFVAQDSIFSFDFTVEELVLMGRYPYRGLLENTTPQDNEVAARAMEQLDLGSYRRRWYSQLSGGEKQRVLLARALAQETDYIFLDESLSQLDINHQIEIMGLLSRICSQQGKGIVLISHNLNLAANYATQLVFLKQGSLVASGSPETLINTELLQQVYGLELPTIFNPHSGRMNILYPL